MEVLDAHSATEALEVLPIEVALEKYAWLRELSYSLVPRDAFGEPDTEEMLGYFIRVRAGEKVTLPVQTCYLINRPDFTQRTHNIVIAEKDSELHLLSGCATNVHIVSGRHLGVTEYFVKENALVTSTMIHSWGDGVEVYPKSAAHVGRNAKFVSNYVALSSVKTLRMDPVAIIEADGLGEFYSVIFAGEHAFFDIGSTVILRGEGASAQIKSRAVSDGGEVITRGKIVGKKAHAAGSMACNGLLLSENGFIHAIPELLGENPNVELSHEASVGMISKEELSYLMASGIEEERARSLIIEGFLDLHIPLLPKYLQRQINGIVKQLKQHDTI